MQHQAAFPEWRLKGHEISRIRVGLSVLFTNMLTMEDCRILESRFFGLFLRPQMGKVSRFHNETACLEQVRADIDI